MCCNDTRLFSPADRRQHVGLSAFRACNAVFPAEAMGRDETFEEACLKMLSAIRTLKMMVGRFDRDSDHGNDNDENHRGDNNHVSGHGISSLKICINVRFLFLCKSGSRSARRPQAGSIRSECQIWGSELDYP